MVQPSDSERFRRVEEAQLLQILFATQEAQRKQAEKHNYIKDME